MAARRRFAFPVPGDTLADVAHRHLAGEPDAGEQIASWNLHLAVRRERTGDDRLLPTDIVYLEPPLP